MVAHKSPATTMEARQLQKELTPALIKRLKRRGITI